jgi:hypothetical protein
MNNIVSKADPRVHVTIQFRVTGGELFLIEQALMGERREYIKLMNNELNEKERVGHSQMIEKHTALISKVQELMKQ